MGHDMKVSDLEQVVKYQLCCGCGVCAYLHSGQIEMIDASAFGRRPKFNKKFLDSEVFLKSLEICPGAGLSHEPEALHQKGLIQSLTKVWGPVFEVWEGHAADPEIRFKGSSGGAISAISLYCLDHEKMHGVLHTMADEERPYLNKTTMSKNRSSILAATGSRYSPASPCEKLQEVENAPAPCLFIGKPCDVAAVNNARRYKSDLDAKIGLTIACFCAGTPSTNGTLEMLRQMGIDSPDELVALQYRGCGWPGKTVAELSNDNNRSSRELTYQQSWGDILQKYRQWRCYICPDHTGEFADISAGDPWYRKITDEEHGRSLLLARSKRGKDVIKKAIEAGYLIAEKVDSSLLPASQPNLIKTRAMLWEGSWLLNCFVLLIPFTAVSPWLHYGGVI